MTKKYTKDGLIAKDKGQWFKTEGYNKDYYVMRDEQNNFVGYILASIVEREWQEIKQETIIDKIVEEMQNAWDNKINADCYWDGNVQQILQEYLNDNGKEEFMKEFNWTNPSLNTIREKLDNYIIIKK